MFFHDISPSRKLLRSANANLKQKRKTLREVTKQVHHTYKKSAQVSSDMALNDS
jgi:uncharacterized protein YlxP (DUF503 family)